MRCVVGVVRSLMSGLGCRGYVGINGVCFLLATDRRHPAISTWIIVLRELGSGLSFASDISAVGIL